MKNSSKKIHQFVTKIFAIDASTKQKVKQLTFMARAMVMATPRHSNAHTFERKNGHCFQVSKLSDNPFISFKIFG